MYATERQDVIERLLAEHGRVGVVELAERFGVTGETVRRDLAALETAGSARRVHGGAIAPARSSLSEPSVAERTTTNADAKQRIALRALDALGSSFDGSVFVDAGTSTASFARLLPDHLGQGSSADVIVHSIALAPALAEAPEIALTLIGGRVRGATSAAVGASTVATIAALRPDIAFIGTNGISAGFGVSTPDIEEAAVKAAIVASSRRVVLLADASKFGVESLRRFATLDQLDVLVTDVEPDDDLSDALSVAGVEVWRA